MRKKGESKEEKKKKKEVFIRQGKARKHTENHDGQ